MSILYAPGSAGTIAGCGVGQPWAHPLGCEIPELAQRDKGPSAATIGRVPHQAIGAAYRGGAIGNVARAHPPLEIGGRTRATVATRVANGRVVLELGGIEDLPERREVVTRRASGVGTGAVLSRRRQVVLAWLGGAEVAHGVDDDVGRADGGIDVEVGARP